MRNGSLWSNVVFEKEVTFDELDFETSYLDLEVLKSSIWKHTTLCDKGVFSFIIMSQLRQPIDLKFSQVCYFIHMLRYIEWEDWSLTITNSVQCLQTGPQLPVTSGKLWPPLVAKTYVISCFGHAQWTAFTLVSSMSA